MKTIRTVTQVVERNEQIGVTPKFNKQDYVEIYSGTYEGHCFTIADIRYNYDTERFEYLYYSYGIMGGWIPENNVVSSKSQRSHSSAG